MSSPSPRPWPRVVARVLGALVFSYAVSAGLVALGAVALPRATSLPTGEAVVLSSMLGFPVFVAALLWAFSQRTLGFRRSMAWLHTWSGVVLGGVLFAVFWMGTLSVFDREIDRWMMPATRLPAPPTQLALDTLVRPVAERLAPRSSQWQISLPTERVPTLQLRWKDAAGDNVVRDIDPTTGAVLGSAGTLGGTGFIYPFHYRLHLSFLDLGSWLVGLAAVCMLVALVSGVVIHRRLFLDFFRLRPTKRTERVTLDLHNLSGVVALPFHLMVALSGLVIMFALYFPSGWQAAYHGDRQAFTADSAGTYKRDRAKRPGTLASLDAMTAEARRLWGHGEPAQVRVWYPKDANAYVEVRRSVDDRVTMDREVIYFDGASGSVLSRSELGPVMTAQRFIEGLHMVQHRHWTLRGFYFVAGLAGCVLVATGLLFWLSTRRAQHAPQPLAVRVVEALAVGVIAGIIAATIAFFVANRLLPPDARFAGFERADLEMWVFYLVWLSSFAHAAWRGHPAWAEQSLAVAVLAITAVLLNWITTGHHLLFSVRHGSHAVAGMDLLLLAGAAIAWRVSRRLRRRSTRLATLAPSLSAEAAPEVDADADAEAEHA